MKGDAMGVVHHKGDKWLPVIKAGAFIVQAAAAAAVPAAANYLKEKVIEWRERSRDDESPDSPSNS